MRAHLVSLLLCGTCLAAIAAEPATSAAKAADRPTDSFPYTPGLDVSAMDKTADACVDFYQYTCGGWMKNNPIPSDQPRWSVYGKLTQDNQRFLWGILEGLAKQSKGRNARQAQIGDYFGACMNEDAVEKLGADPLRPHLAMIASMRAKSDLLRVLAALHPGTGSAGLFFGFGSNQDFGDSSKVITFATAGGLSLPDRDYYLKPEEKSKLIREQYVAHIAKMFGLLGDADDAAKRHADTVMAMETALAKASLSRVDKRDPYKLFHKVDAKGLSALTPGFSWPVYVKALGMPAQKTFNVTEPEFFKALEALLQSSSLDDIKTYLRWHLVNASAPYLSRAFVNQDFQFFSKTLRGVPEMKPRWKRCVALVDNQLGEALGQEFVSRAFSAGLKRDSLRMTQQIEKAMSDDLDQLPWMSAETKHKAIEKLHSVVNKIGYPDQWRDYSKMVVKANDFAGNVWRGNLFESRRDLNKIGRPLDRKEWSMTPPTVNAYYNPQMNDINFPAGVLQPPLYDPKMDDAPNYGNTGGTIGHELTHGFDDEGRQFDAKGNLKDWWTEKDGKEFTDRAGCIVDQYAQYTIVDEIKINSKLTLGEDIADLGGLVLAWSAWKAEVAGKKLEARDGFTPEQRFFIGYAQWACENARPEDLRNQALTNPHSPGKYRVNGLVVNMPEFEQAFACKPGQPMAAVKRCRVW
ncbi:MAG: M13 family metallopeptidase [Betaproteobacteria bacterium]|nr:M13 family metallopeptidase [Betaproteobacteria bacterium]